MKYYCSDEGFYYNLREELFPININYKKKSTFTGKLIKVLNIYEIIIQGKMINITNKIFMPYSLALEWLKFVPYISEDDKFDKFETFQIN